MLLEKELLMSVRLRASISKTAILVIGAFYVLSGTPRAFAVDVLDDPIQIDDRLNQVIQTSNSLSWEMYKYHQAKPDFMDNYRAAKQLWTQATQIQEALRSGPFETEALQQRAIEMNQAFSQLQANLAKWGPGDQSSLPMAGGVTQREVVAPGVGINVPFVGLQIGGGDVIVTEDGPPQLKRIRLHQNARGSKRSLERELESLRISLNYLAEDAGVATDNLTDTAAPQQPAANGKPTPRPPTPAPPTPAPDGEVVKPRT
jgi:hypothetical protein